MPDCSCNEYPILLVVIPHEYGVYSSSRLTLVFKQLAFILSRVLADIQILSLSQRGGSGRTSDEDAGGYIFLKLSTARTEQIVHSSYSSFCNDPCRIISVPN